GLEAVRIAKMREPPPGEDEGVLQRVLGEAGVAQDPVSDRVERVADLVHQDRERLPIAPTGPLDEVSIHPVPSGGVAAEVAAITHLDGSTRAKRSAARDRCVAGVQRPVMAL